MDLDILEEITLFKKELFHYKIKVISQNKSVLICSGAK